MKNFQQSARLPFLVVLLIGCLCLTGPACWAQRSQTVTAGVTASRAVPNVIKYSGVLKDPNGEVITALKGVTFLIYKDEQGGAPLWVETQNVQPDKAGRYTVQLGAVSKDGLPPDVFMTGEARWLAVQVAEEAEQARISLVAVPYAMKAADAETVGGKPASAFVLAQPQASSGSTSKAESSNALLPNVGGTGAANFIAKWTSSSNLGKSVIFQTNATSATPNLVGVNTQTPAAQLDTEAPAIVSTGIQGVTPSTAFFAAGVFGHATGASGLTRGVYGVADSPSGIGVHGIAATGGQFETGTGLILKGRGFGHDQFLLDASGNMRLSGGISAGGSGTIQIDAPGVSGGRFTILANGLTGINNPNPTTALEVAQIPGSPNSDAIRATAGSGRAMHGISDDPNLATLRLDNNNTSSSAYVLAAHGDAFGGECDIFVNGDLSCTGSKSAVVAVENHRMKALYAVEAPENWFEDFGVGTLVNGTGSIRLEATFAQTVNTAMEYHVFLTPKGDCRGLYVSNETQTGFEVHELGGGKSNVAFDYRIVAPRKGYASLRTAALTDRMNRSDGDRELSRKNRSTRPMTK